MLRPRVFSPFQLFIHAASWIPLILLLINFLGGTLTANPIQEIEQRTGQYAVIWLLLSLACTPVHTVFRFHPALKVRRALGLYAFLYAALHFLTFVFLDYGFDLGLIWRSISNKPFIIVGALALLILLALALTSTQKAMRQMKTRWKTLHRMAYVAGGLAVLHYIWAVKTDLRLPLIYAAILFTLLILRLPIIRRRFLKRDSFKIKNQ